MPPKLTEEERIASDLRKAEYARNWRAKNAEKFNSYMHDYYIANKKLINDRRNVNAKIQRKREKVVAPEKIDSNI
jgi:hypothetical protein